MLDEFETTMLQQIVRSAIHWWTSATYETGYHGPDDQGVLCHQHTYRLPDGERFTVTIKGLDRPPKDSPEDGPEDNPDGRPSGR